MNRWKLDCPVLLRLMRPKSADVGVLVVLPLVVLRAVEQVEGLETYLEAERCS